MSENNTKQSPVIFRKGKSVYIRPILPEDLPKFLVWINSFEVSQYLALATPVTPAGIQKWYDEVDKNDGQLSRFAILLCDTAEVIGIMDIKVENQIARTGSTGSYIGPEYWSKGYGTEAKMLVLEYAFNSLNLRKICSAVYDFNGRSKRCLEKCGYKVEGRRKAQYFKNGKYVDDYLMAVFREDFLKLWKKFDKKLLSK